MHGFRLIHRELLDAVCVFALLTGHRTSADPPRACSGAVPPDDRTAACPAGVVA